MTKNLETTLQSYKEGVRNAITINDFLIVFAKYIKDVEEHLNVRKRHEGVSATEYQKQTSPNKRTNNQYKRNISKKS